MQTFLPAKDFSICAQILDSKRLNKQILECYQILKVISNDDPFAGWRNHPAVKMWRGHEMVLLRYVTAMVNEADKRGIKTDKNKSNINALYEINKHWWSESYPLWYQNTETMKQVVATHRANLFNKDPEYYATFYIETISDYNKPCCDSCRYFWPTHTREFAHVA